MLSRPLVMDTPQTRQATAATYQEQMDDDLCICPYCEHSYQVEGEDYDEDARAMECGVCGRRFYLHQTFHVTHHATPDCRLNGGEHDYRPQPLDDDTTHPFCAICDKPVEQRAAS